MTIAHSPYQELLAERDALAARVAELERIATLHRDEKIRLFCEGRVQGWRLAREQAAKTCEDADVDQFTHCLVLHDDGPATLRNAAEAIRGMQPPADWLSPEPTAYRWRFTGGNWQLGHQKPWFTEWYGYEVQALVTLP